MILGICESPNVLEIMNIVVTIIKVIITVVPIILLFSLIFKAVSAATQGKEDALAKLKKKAVPNIIAAVLIFLIPTLVSLIVTVSFPESDYTKCISGISRESIQEAYEDKAEKLVRTAEETLNINDYSAAMSYMPNVKDDDKRESYEKRLEEVKKLIDEARKPEGKVDYSSFKWTYYSPDSGPVAEYYKYTISYAIYAPEDASSLNGVSLPILIWLHGAGVTYDIIQDGDKFLSRNIFPMFTNWSQYGLEPIPAIIIAPQCPAKDTHWSNNRIYSSIRGMISYVKDKYNANPEDVALVGHSMGGGGALLIQDNMQGTFRTVVPMSFCCGYIGHAEEYYNLRMKGYDEDCESEKIFKWMHHENDYTCLRGMKHEDVPIYAFTTDADKNGVSDLVEWLFAED